MFIGTINRLDVSKTVLVETLYIDRFDPAYLSNDCFSIILIKKGSLTARIKEKDCHIPAPAVICLDDTKKVNKNQIENLFKEYLNTTFYDYLMNRRYEEATYYLRFTELDGEQIASRIGLSSSQNFCKFFKKMSGTTPNTFRKETVKRRKSDAELLEILQRKKNL